MIQQRQQLYSVRDAAEILGISPSRVRQLLMPMEEDEKPGRIIGNSRVFEWGDIETLKEIPRINGRPKKNSHRTCKP